jgi:hypothetical protein
MKRAVSWTKILEELEFGSCEFFPDPHDDFQDTDVWENHCPREYKEGLEVKRCYQVLQRKKGEHWPKECPSCHTKLDPKDLTRRAYHPIDWDAWELECSVRALQEWTKLTTEHPNQKWYIFEYSDNDGSLYSAMEHGDLFKARPHIRVSKH